MTGELKGKKVTVPNWIIKKHTGFGMGYELRTLEVIRETEKAVLVSFDEFMDFWCPKSQIERVVENDEESEMAKPAKELMKAIYGIGEVKGNE